MKPFIDPSFWSDPDIEAQKAGVKLCALWLITNTQTSLLGVCGASTSRFCFETNLPIEALESTLKALPDSFVKIGCVVFVKNYIRHQFGTGEKLTKNNFFVALKSLFCGIKEEALRSAILKEYPEFREALSKGLPRAYQAQGKDRREGEGKVRGFTPPTIQEAKAYGQEIGMTDIDVEGWHDHFTSNGWRVGGKASMKDWKSGMRNGKRIKGHNGKNPEHAASGTVNGW